MLRLEDIINANSLISEYIYITPIIELENINNIADEKIYLKCESLQKTGSFKVR